MKPPVVEPLTADDIEWGAAIPAPSDPPLPEARRFQGTNPVPSSNHDGVPEDPGVALPLTPVGDLLAEAEETVDYVVDGLIQTGSVNVLSAKPKVGKSTLARNIALAVARGDEVLGRTCPLCGTVWYLAFEGRRRDIRAHFRQMGATADDPLWVLVSQAPKDIVAQVRTRAIKERPQLIIIDTMQRFLKAKSTDDYAEMTLLFDQVIGIAQKSGAAMLLVTHNSKVERSGLDAILGSTAIAGSADTTILLTRSARYRTISTVQRTGVDLEETVLQLDKSDGRLRLAGSRALADQELVVRQLYEALEAASGPLSQSDLFEPIEARRALKVAALKILVSGSHKLVVPTGRNVSRIGPGTRNNPYRYELDRCVCSSLVPVQKGELENSSLSLGVFPNDSGPVSSSRVPAQKGSPREPEKNPGTTKPEHDDGDRF